MTLLQRCEEQHLPHIAMRAMTGATTDLILNLKRVPLKMHVDHPKALTLRTSEPGEVRAKHITPDADIEVLDPEAAATSRPTRTSTRISRSDGSRSTRCTRPSRR